MLVNLQSHRSARRVARFALWGAFGLSVSTAAVAAVQSGNTAAPAPTKTTPVTSLHTAVEGANVVATVLQRSIGKDGNLVDKARLRMTVSSSGVARIERQSLTPPDANDQKQPLPNTTLAFFDGKETIEYDADNHKYIRYAAAPGGSPLSHYIPVRSLWFAARGYTEKPLEAAPDDTIDGRRMLVFHGDIKRAGETQPLIRSRYLIDAETRLMRREELITWLDDKPRLISQYEYSGWIINPKISGETFAWQPPADAKETSFPKITAPPRPALLAAGTPAPDFTCLGAGDKPVKLSDFKGKVVILDFWATWCGPCQKSMPHLEKVYQQVKDKDVVVLALSVSDLRPDYDKWLVQFKDKYTFPVAYDPAGRDSSKSISSTLFKVSGIPTQYIIDKDGKVAASLVGYGGAGDHRLEDELGKLGVSLPEPAKEAAPAR